MTDNKRSRARSAMKRYNVITGGPGWSTDNLFAWWTDAAAFMKYLLDKDAGDTIKGVFKIRQDKK